MATKGGQGQSLLRRNGRKMLIQYKKISLL